MSTAKSAAAALAWAEKRKAKVRVPSVLGGKGQYGKDGRYQKGGHDVMMFVYIFQLCRTVFCFLDIVLLRLIEMDDYTTEPRFLLLLL